MTLIDVDGHLPPAELAMAGAEAAARTILRHNIAGSIGIDLPTLAGKAQRQEIGTAVDAILPQPFERTAMNGFGFIQIVRPRARASLFELAADRAAFEARALLRRAASKRSGRRRLIAHPSVIRVLEQHPDWPERLSRHVGGAVTLRGDPSLPIHAGLCRRLLIQVLPAFAVSRRLRSMRLSAPAAARIATCSAGSTRAIALRVQLPIPRGGQRGKRR